MGQKFELPACFCTFWRVFCSLGVNHMWFVAEFISLLTYIFAHGLCGTVHRSLYSSHKLKYPLHVFLFFPFLVQEVLPVDVSRSAEICTGKKHQQTSHVSVQHLSWKRIEEGCNIKHALKQESRAVREHLDMDKNETLWIIFSLVNLRVRGNSKHWHKTYENPQIMCFDPFWFCSNAHFHLTHCVEDIPPFAKGELHHQQSKGNLADLAVHGQTSLVNFLGFFFSGNSEDRTVFIHWQMQAKNKKVITIVRNRKVKKNCVQKCPETEERSPEKNGKVLVERDRLCLRGSTFFALTFICVVGFGSRVVTLRCPVVGQSVCLSVDPQPPIQLCSELPRTFTAFCALVDASKKTVHGDSETKTDFFFVYGCRKKTNQLCTQAIATGWQLKLNWLE